MARGTSIFQGGPILGQTVDAITFALMSWEVTTAQLRNAAQNTVPDGFAGTSPQVVKTLDGEFLIYADYTAEFVPLGRTTGTRFPI